MEIAANLENIAEAIKTALAKTKKPKKDFSLVVVTKNRDLTEINQVLNQGYYVLGENRVQELKDKFDNLPSNIQWHLIGNLQKNKVKYITDKVKLIHSLDSDSLAEEINKRMKPLNTPMNCLVQVNVSLEESKHGLAMDEVIPFLKRVSLLPWVKIEGLMTMAPEVENPEEARPVFRELASLAEKVKEENIHNVDMKWLSMGMTNDFRVAIEEGANMVRVGSAIFGPR